MAEVTVAALVYRDIRWIEWMLDGLRRAKTNIDYRVMVVSNDGTPEVEASPLVTHKLRNPDPDEYYLARVYRAWNKAVMAAPTQWVVLMNSDMYVSDWWLDELMACKRAHPMSLPTSLLVESGKLESAMPEWVHDFGRTPDAFDREGFLDFAAKGRQRALMEPGRLFMPVLFDRQEFLDIGGYPEGNPVVDGKQISGDRALFDVYAQRGFRWMTCLGSIVYHAQEGERDS